MADPTAAVRLSRAQQRQQETMIGPSLIILPCHDIVCLLEQDCRVLEEVDAASAGAVSLCTVFQKHCLEGKLIPASFTCLVRLKCGLALSLSKVSPWIAWGLPLRRQA